MKRLCFILLCLLLPALSVLAADGLSARWEMSSSTRKSGTWTAGEGQAASVGNATLRFVGASPRLGYEKKGSVSVAEVHSGDFFEFSMPVEYLPRGAEVDFGLFMGVSAEGGPERWVCELFDGRRWRSNDEEVSFTLTKDSFNNPTSYITTFRLSRALRKTDLRVRLRSLDSAANDSAAVYFMPSPRMGAYMAAWPQGSRRAVRVLMIGNSFTFFGAAHFALLEIAHSQGLRLDVRANLKGGQNFTQHLALPRTQEAIAAGGYELAFLNNHSQAASSYARDSAAHRNVREECIALAREVRKYSPQCRLILERTWAIPKDDWQGYGSAEYFDACLAKGCAMLAPCMGADISPIGEAFAVGREYALPIYWKDNYHQNALGAYLKACVNYLVLTGEHFREPVADYGLEAGEAALCREIATETVFR